MSTNDQPQQDNPNPPASGAVTSSSAPQQNNQTQLVERPLKLYFGEFRLVCLIYLQTSLLLCRATAWQLHEILEFDRKVQLPYFTTVPNSLVQDLVLELVDEVAKLAHVSGDGNPSAQAHDSLKQVTELIEAKDCQELLHQVNAVNSYIEDYCTALTKRVDEELAKLDGEQNKSQEKIDHQKRIVQDIKLATKNSRIPTTQGVSLFEFQRKTQPADKIEVRWDKKFGATFLQAAMNIANEYRNLQRPDTVKRQTVNDRLAFHAAHYLLSQGQNEFDPYKSRFLGTVGFREQDCQTYLSLTDPGQGHVFGTTTRSDWMRGAIVHVEHLERPAHTTQAQIESYRIPSVREFARVCLHTGYAAPNTCYVGRPLRDSGDFKYDFIKLVDTVSSACTSIFHLGAAECKIGMSGLKASEMVAYMRALKGHTLKNYRQYFSAAFNLNTPLIDDIEERYIKDRVKIGMRAIELTVLGGFNKVTWDGASDSYPSIPMLKAEEPDKQNDGQLSFADALKLVHKAHSVGLTTYFSAGFKLEHIKIAVYSGVDGVGIGGAQVLRGMDHTSGMHGEYQESRIEELLNERDQAAKDTRGLAAQLLARLDQMFFEGSINEAENKLRIKLFDTLKRWPLEEGYSKEKYLQDIDDILKLKELSYAKGLPGDAEHPWVGRALRLLQGRGDQDSLLEKHGIEHNQDWTSFSSALIGYFKDYMKDGSSFSETNLQTLKPGHLKLEDMELEGAIHSLALSSPWKDMRKKYQKWASEHEPRSKKGKPPSLPEYFMDEIEVALKTTPFGDPSSKVVLDLFRGRGGRGSGG
ncbi:hypothetical protein FRC12_010431 [Ceratobasidium sp. 428]|nr:hypothetical protein FRC12_010431 [Ceratobasidium sp. 428]